MASLSDAIVAREPLASSRSVQVTIYTDPGCQFGFNSQRQELQLMWAYGHLAEIVRRMIGLSEASSSFEEIGLPVELVERTRKRLAGQYGMCRWDCNRSFGSPRRWKHAAPTSAR